MSNMVIDNKNELFVDADTVHFLQSARKQVWCDIVVGSGSLKWRDIFISFLQLWFVNVDDAPEVAPALVIDIGNWNHRCQRYAVHRVAVIISDVFY